MGKINLNLKRVNFENTILFWILNEEKNLIGRKNKITKKTISKKDWEESYNQIRQICILIRNNIDEAKFPQFEDHILDSVTKENESQIMATIFNEVYQNLKIFITITNQNGYENYIDKISMSKNKTFSVKKSKISLEEQENDLYMEKVSSNLEFLRIGNCRDYSIYMLSIFQMLGFSLEQISIVLMPKHMFVRYIGNNSILNFETMYEDWGIKTPFLENDGYIQKFQSSFSKTYDLKTANLDEIKSSFYMNYGMSLSELFNDNNLSRVYMEKAIKLYPKFGEYYFYFAQLLVKSEEYYLAGKMFEKATKGKNYSDSAVEKSIDFTNYLKKYDGLKGEIMYEQRIEQDKDNSEIYFEYARFLSNCSKYEKAEKMYRKAINLNPKSSKYYYSFAYVLEHCGKLPLAKKMFEKAIENNSENKEYLYMYANFLENKFYNKSMGLLSKPYRAILSKKIKNLYSRFIDLVTKNQEVESEKYRLQYAKEFLLNN